MWGVAYGQSKVYIRGDSIVIQKVGGNSNLIIENATKNVTGGVLTNTGNGRTAFVLPSSAGTDSVFRVPGKDSVFWIKNGITYAFKDSTGGGGSSFTKEGVYKRSDTIVIDNNRNIYYITQPTSGGSLASGWTAVGTPGYSVSNGTWIFGGNAENNTQYIRNNSGVLAEGSYIEAYVIVDSLRTSSIGPRLTWRSYNPFAGAIYTHNVEAGIITGSGASNTGKAIIYGKTGNSTNLSDSARVTNVGDTLYLRLDHDGLAYTIKVENLTQDWKLQKTVQNTPGGSPFTVHNSSYVGFIPGGGGYKVYGFRYVVKPPLQTELCIIGNSITQRQGALTEGSGFASLIGNPANNVVMGGGADGVSEVLARVGETIAIKPKAALLMIGGNDILFDGSLTTTTKNEYISIRDQLVAAGISVIHCYPTPRTSTDISALKIWIDTSSAFRSDIKIDTYTPLLGTGTTLNTKYDADGTHPNDAGHAMIASTINTALHYNNGDALYAAKNVFARNGYIAGTDAGTGADQNKSGGLIAFKSNSNTEYMHGGFISDYGWLNAISEGSAYRDIGISTAGTTKLFVGSPTNRTATLNITNPTAGTTEAFALKHNGAYSAVDQELQMAWYNSTSIKTGMITNYVGPGSQFGQKFYTYNSTIQTTPVLTLTGNQRAGILQIVPISGLDVNTSARFRDSLIHSGATLKAVDTTTYKVKVIDPSTGYEAYMNWAYAGTGGGGGGVSSVAAGLGMNFTTITSTGSVDVDTLYMATRARLLKIVDSLNSLYGTTAFIQNQYGSAQSARFWIAGSGQSDSSFRGRTVGNRDGFKTGGLLAYASSGTTSYLQLGYDATGNYGWIQALTEGSAYRNLLLSPAGTTLVGVGNVTPTDFMHVQANTASIAQLMLANSATTLTTLRDGQVWNNGHTPRMRLNGNTRRFAMTNDAAPSNGQVPIGNGTDFTLGNITSTGNTLTVTNGAGTINVDIPSTIITSGTYTPTLTNTTNVTSSTAFVNIYSRVGGVVQFSIKVEVTATGAGNTVLGISIPVASNFAAVEDAIGPCTSNSEVGTITADTTNDRLTLTYNAQGAGSDTFYITLQYIITN